MELGLSLGLNRRGAAGGSLDFYDMDFVNNTFVGGEVKFDDAYYNDMSLLYWGASNFTSSWVENSDGTLTAAVANRLIRSDLGLRVSQNRNNDALYNRDLTNAVWVKSNITASKNQVGVDTVSNSASSITSTANNGTILQSITDASAQRILSAYVKRLSGSGTLEMTQDGGSTWTTVTVTSDFSRLQIPAATLANPEIGFRIGTSGDSFAIDFVQSETGNIIGSPISTNGSVVTNWADYGEAGTHSSVKSPLADLVTRGGFGWYMELSATRLEQFGPFVSDGHFQVRVDADGAVTNGLASTSSGEFVRGYGVYNKIAGYTRANGDVAICCNGNAVGTDTGTAPGGYFDHFNMGTNGSGGLNIAGYIKRVQFQEGEGWDAAKLVELTS